MSKKEITNNEIMEALGRNVLDDHMKRIETILQENQVQKYQQERMERWIFQLADRLDVKLKYE